MKTITDALWSLPPDALSNLLMLSVVRGKSDLVLLQSVEDGFELTAQSGATLIGTFRIQSVTGVATGLRVAHLAGIDPIEIGGAGPAYRTGRIQVTAGVDSAELFVSVTASPRGFELELRPLVVNARFLKRASHGTLRRCPTCATYQPAQRATCETDGSLLVDVEDSPVPGGTIGSYRIGEVIGQGGMGIVLSGVHALLDRPVAIKLLHASLADHPTMGRSFLLEARAASRIRHPNVVEIGDYGLLRDGRPFIVMERVEGVSLQAYLERAGTITPTEALLIAREIALGLAAAHEGGVVHLDLKPLNVLVLVSSTPTVPRIKLVDFGASSLIGAPMARDSAGIVGTPAYMSPEHARGEPADHRSDLYALGVVLFEMLSGAVPFDGETAVEVLLAHLSKAVPELVSPSGPLPEAVFRLVSRALRKKVDERYQSAGTMLIDIDAAIAATSRSAWRRWLPS